MSSNRERQVDELVLLESMYLTEFTWLTSDGQAPDPSGSNLPDPKINLKLLPDFTLEIRLPSDYPESAKPIAYLVCGSEVATSTRKCARQYLSDVLRRLEVGVECLDLLVQDLTPMLQDLVGIPNDAGAEGAESGSKFTGQRDTTTIPRKIKTTLLWSHHLLATSKRKDIIAWSRELHLGGFSRPGYPGAILIEGEESEVEEFVARIKGLRWQALQVRGEEIGERRRITAGNRENADGIGNGMVVREVEGLGDIVDELKKVDDGEAFAQWFLEGMRIGHG